MATNISGIFAIENVRSKNISTDHYSAVSDGTIVALESEIYLRDHCKYDVLKV